MGPKRGFGMLLDAGIVAENPNSYTIGATGRELEFRAFRFDEGKLFLKDTAVSLGTLSADDIDMTNKVPCGKGASGVVYFATMKGSNHPVAVKAIPISSKPHRDEVERELMFVGNAHQNPYVVHNFGAWWEPQEESIYIAMEFMAFSLQQLSVFGTGLEEHVVQDIAVQALAGLAHLHDVRKVIHRDIKPGNMLVASDGTVKISDFGVSKVVETLNASSTYIGTLLFMAPERLEENAYAFPSDVWSFGLSLISIATGKQPWYPPEDLNLYQLLERMSTGAIPSFPDSFSAEAKDFVSKCLVRDPAVRPSCADLLKHPFVANVDPQEAKGRVAAFVSHMSRLVQSGAATERKVDKSEQEQAAAREAAMSSLDGLLM